MQLDDNLKGSFGLFQVLILIQFWTLTILRVEEEVLNKFRDMSKKYYIMDPIPIERSREYLVSY